MGNRSVSWVSLAFGVLFVVLGVMLAWATPQAPHPKLAALAALVLLVLGLQHIIATLKNKRSWLSRIGPLP